MCKRDISLDGSQIQRTKKYRQFNEMKRKYFILDIFIM